MYREIAHSLSIEPAGTYPSLLRKLQQYYRSESQQEGLRPLLIIDEAQDMRPEVIATLRILTNFNMDSRLVLSFVLAGDTRLRALLENQDLKPIRQRLAHVHTLRLLTRAETHSYIEHRLQVAGAQNRPFRPQALEAVYELTHGNLRAIDHLCRRALELAADADAQNIDDTLILNARNNLLI
jgi:general secretion pathway protein A